AFGSDSQVEARNVISGTLVWAQVRAWYVPLGGTYEEAQQQGLGGYGESPAFQLIAGHETGAGTIHAPLIGLESFSLRAVIPEPSTLSLLLLSLPVLWLAQRRHHGDLGLPVNSGSK
ncbi:MAG TPA: PEP-CTERM sorting domain-containing protein, partial [Methylomirabilota bacterium]|nr:PEP-CTERM sorting domain-containing protein [Methylomirabilota bacterium]